MSIQCDETLFQLMREHFSVKNPNSRFMKGRFRGVCDRKYVISGTGRCDLGLYWEIRKYLIENQVSTSINMSESLKNALNTRQITRCPLNFTHELREYQDDVVDSALKLGRGVCVLGTGGGKTLTTAALIENYYRSSSNPEVFKCIVLVPDLGLVSQTDDEFSLYGVSFTHSKWSGNNALNTDSNVIVCNASIFLHRFDCNEWIKYVDLLIVDECHKINSTTKLSKAIQKINTHNKYGFTGTLPEDPYEKWAITGILGPVIYEKSSFSLRLEKYLTNVEVKVLKLKYKQPVPVISTNKYRDELDFIYTNESRTTFLVRLCEKLKGNTLILVNHLKHGEFLYDRMKDMENFRVYYIRGEIDVEERDRIKRLMEENSDIICIAISAIFSTGVNIKNIHNIMFVAAGKAFIRTVQSIGRGLRLHDSKDKLTIIDIADDLRYSREHGTIRKAIYTKEKIRYSERTVEFS